MTSGHVDESISLDAMDRQILHGLQAAPRASFALVGQVVGASEQTVARRYRRLVGEGVLRVIGLRGLAPSGLDRWTVRLTCRPDGAAPVAEALARRADVSWVSISAGGFEVVCNVTAARGPAGQELLLQRLPRLAQVQGISAHAMLHHFDERSEWSGFGDPLDAAQRRLLARHGTAEAERAEAHQPMEGDAALFELLESDGRATLRAIADATGWSTSTASRRLQALQGSGALYFDVDLHIERLGFYAMSYIWATVSPGLLDRAGREVASHDEVAYCAAVSGSASLAVSVICRDAGDLYRYVSQRLAAVDGILQVETSPILRRVKQAGSIMTARGVAPVPARRPGAV